MNLSGNGRGTEVTGGGGHRDGNYVNTTQTCERPNFSNKKFPYQSIFSQLTNSA